MSDKPLHVQVAEALGWTECIPFSVYGVEDGEWAGDRPQPGPKSWEHADGGFIPRYDTDWSATGPLIEKHMIELLEAGGAWFARAKTAPNYTDTKWFQNPLLAVCHLILALKEAGKL